MIIAFSQIMLRIKRGYYRYIGSGSGRKVFDLGNGYVIKVAKNRDSAVIFACKAH